MPCQLCTVHTRYVQYFQLIVLSGTCMWHRKWVNENFTLCRINGDVGEHLQWYLLAPTGALIVMMCYYMSSGSPLFEILIIHALLYNVLLMFYHFAPSVNHLKPTSPLWSPSLKCKTPFSTLVCRFHHLEMLTLEESSTVPGVLDSSAQSNGVMDEATHHS